MFLILSGVLLTMNLLPALPAEDVLKSKHPDVGLTTIQMIKRQGYVAEEHTNVQTSDGYLLDLHRMPNGKSNGNQTNKPVIFLMHGLLSSSADWVNMGPDKSIAYQLVEAGCDVWMGNARGSKWSRKHITYNPDWSFQYWKFSWHEIGTIDLPTMIDYVLNVTNQKKLYYIGHSQGTTSFFVMGSERPEYNEKIRLMVALAPVAYMSNLINPFFQLVSKLYKVLEVINIFGIYEFLPNTRLNELIGQVCNDESIFQEVCASVFFLIAGWDSEQLNRTMIPVILSNAPAGSSTRQIIHYAQEIRSGKFRKYDYGLIGNVRKYKSAFPPNYKPTAITAPVALIYSANDWLAAVVDVKQLADELPNLVTSYLVPNRKFNHIDFLYAIDCRELVYNRVLQLMEEY